MSTNKKESFNIEPLVYEIENVLKNGLNKILNEYIHRYDLLEKTHQQIMLLPSVLHELNITPISHVETKIKGICDDSVKKYNISPEFSIINNKISIIEHKYEAVSETLDKILLKLETLNSDIKIIKETKHVVVEQKNNTFIKPSIVAACENENIKFEINDNDSICEECEVNKFTQEEQEEEEQEEQEEEQEEVVEEEQEEEVEEEQEEEVEEEQEEEEVVEEKKQVVVEVADEKLICSACDCKVVLNEYITVIDGKNYCGACKPKDDDVETEKSESESESEKEEEEEEEELVEIEIDDITYCTNNEDNGFIYELTTDGDVGDKVGYLKEGEPFFYADEK
jgi:hypothetical protein